MGMAFMSFMGIKYGKDVKIKKAPTTMVGQINNDKN
jgi:hypothetical protein